MNRFIEDALIDKLEEMEDLDQIRFESTRSLKDVIKDLKLDGKI